MRRSTSRSLVALAGAVGMIVTACGGTDAAEPAAEPAQTEPAQTEAVDTDSTQPLEPVLVPTASGEQLDFNSLRGQDVLLWFWAPW